ncbi:PREDICTED: lipase maturation factor 1 isoform X5 [Cercocebus atys]|uniref:lipase maturation factor 1 isoform X5 n=1 Tax=Cercocebus atys TaxID=9531 RepID=UPI0005F4485A|nr:PREDICTED: lipase maturation factor 1 isoform X5 [Cercocebus atys]
MRPDGPTMAAPEESLRRRKTGYSHPEPESPPVPGRDPAVSPAHLHAGTFWLTRIVLLKALAFVYFVAFLVAFHQNKQLIGDRGLLPCRVLLNNFRQYFQDKTSWEVFSYMPTILWLTDWSDMNSTLDSLALLGLGISSFVLITGCANMLLMAALWGLYMSLVNVGHVWMGVPASGNRVPGDLPVPAVDAVEAAPAHPHIPDCPVGLPVADLQDHVRSNAAGAQPSGILPTPLTLVVPPLRDTQHPLHRAPGALLPLPRPAGLHHPRGAADPVPGHPHRQREPQLPELADHGAQPGLLRRRHPGVLVPLRARQPEGPSPTDAEGNPRCPAQAQIRISKERTEVILQGTASPSASAPDAVWEDYEFKCKPGDPSRRPCLISPYHYRLDWLMWFASFQTYEHNDWILHLAGKLLASDAEALSLLAHNPFASRPPPRWVRGEHYRYKFSRPGGRHATEGKWWVRKRIGAYFPPLSLEELRPYFRDRGWPLPQPL